MLVSRLFARRVALGLSLMTLLVSRTPAQPDSALTALRNGAPLVVAYGPDSAPFSYELAGKPIGYTLSLCQQVAEALREQLGLKQLPINYVPVTSTSRFERVMQRSAHMECDSTTNNAERRKKVAFSIPHYVSGARILVRSDSPLQDLADFRDHRLVVTRDTTSQAIVAQALREANAKIQVLVVDDFQAGLRAVETRQADGYVMDDILLFALRARHPKPETFRVTGRRLSVEPLAVMMSKDDPTFKSAVDAAMRKVIQSGEAQRLYARWFQQAIPGVPGNGLGIPMNYLQQDYWRSLSDFVP